MYEITAVPKLIIIQDDGDVITKKGRKEVQDRGYLSYRNWKQVATLVDGGTLNPERERASHDEPNQLTDVT